MERSFDLSNDLALFALVARHGGLSAAARAAGIPKSRLSRRVMQLEERLGARLIERSSRRFVVTALGRQILGHAAAIGESAAAAAEVAQSHTAEPRGLVRIACPLGIDRQIAGLIWPLLADHPALRVQILPANRPVDLIEEQVDIALRVRPGLEAEAEFSVRPLARQQSLLVAAPGLAAAIGGGDPAALACAPTLGRTGQPGEDRWRLVRASSGEAREVRHLPRFSTGSFEPLRQAALAGLGVALLPVPVCSEDLRAGRLRRVLPEWSAPEQMLFLVHVSRRAVMRGVRVVLDALIAGLDERR